MLAPHKVTSGKAIVIHRFKRLPFAVRFALAIAVIFLVIFAQHVLYPAPD
jgi:hypothetical protein